MNKFFKMSLVAAAVAVTGTATAGTFTGNDAVVANITANENAVTLSTEGVLALGTASADKQYLPAISYTLGAAYIVGDELSIVFSADLDADTVFPATILVGGATFDRVLVDLDATVAIPAATLTGGYVTYRVVAGSAPRDTVFTIPAEKSTVADLTDATKAGIVVTTNDLFTVDAVPAITAIDKMLVEAVSTTNNGSTAHDLDTTVAKANILAVHSTQYGEYKVDTKLKAVIDGLAPVNSEAFTNGQLDDSLVYSYVAPKTVPTQAVVGKDIGLNDLSATQIDTIVDVTTTGDLRTGFTFDSAAGGVVTTPDATSLVITYASAADVVANDTIKITPKTGASAAAIAANVFTLAATANTVDLTPTADAAGEWYVSGSTTVNVPYMPYGTGLSQVIYVANGSTADAEVTVTASDETGTVYDLGVVGIAKGSAVTKLSKVIKDALAADGFETGKLDMNITFRGNNADGTAGITGADIKLHSAYNANSTDRGFVTNSTNGSADVN